MIHTMFDNFRDSKVEIPRPNSAHHKSIQKPRKDGMLVGNTWNQQLFLVPVIGGIGDI